ncbi:uromodulin-like 1 isoform X2 [Ranitomeya imitator]|uniref:uromodulin-like 1 isoform X2 n=1 Tax=Ranitomeya imitator TaxID=111125 RepID=UPI0037E9869A
MDEKAILYLSLVGMAVGLGSAQMLGDIISPWSYHVCNQTVTVNVSKMVEFQKSREEPTWCMSWIPWKLCTRMTYKSEYRTVYVAETSTVRRCCEGYQPVGHYCALSLKDPRTARPGICPEREDKKNSSKCTSDYDCPGLQKCCLSSNGSFCVSPAPPALDRKTIKYWYNGTIVVKMGYNKLIQLDEGLVNQTRLLHSMVTGEFWPLKAEVFHISTKSAGTFSIVSSVLIGINESLPLMNIAAILDNIVIRLPEVISIEINDLNECLHPELVSCLSYQECINVEGSYNCTNKNRSESLQEIATHPGPIPLSRPSQLPPFPSHPTFSPIDPGSRPSHPLPSSSHPNFSSIDPGSHPSQPPPSSSHPNFSSIDPSSRPSQLPPSSSHPTFSPIDPGSHPSQLPPSSSHPTFSPLDPGSSPSHPLPSSIDPGSSPSHLLLSSSHPTFSPIDPGSRSSHPLPSSSHPTFSPIDPGSSPSHPLPSSIDPGSSPSHPPPSSSHPTFSPLDPGSRPTHLPFSTAATTQDATYDIATAAPCNCSTFHDHSIFNVTSSGFHLHWITDCSEDFTYNVQVSGKGFNQSKTIMGTTMEMQGLQAGELYTAQVTFMDCNGLVQLWNGRVKTEAHTLNATLKIENWNLTESLMDPSSPDYTNFLQKFISEVKRSLSHEIPPERVSVEVDSLSAGSIIVYFRIIVNDSVNLRATSFSAFSDEFHVDPGSIVVTDLNECLSPADNDCHLYANCKNLDGSYTCQCHPSFVDKDPSRPGRNCEGHIGPSLSPMSGEDPRTGGPSVGPVNTAHPVTTPHPGHPTTENGSKINYGFQHLSSPVTPITPSANVSGGPSQAQSVLSTPVHAVNSTPPAPVLPTSHKTAAGNFSPVTGSTAEISAPGISTASQLKSALPSTASVKIITAAPMSTGPTTSREISCSFPIVGANVGSANMTMSPPSTKTTTLKPPGLTLKDASTVICKTEKIGISIEKAFLKMMSIAAHSLFLGSPECSVNCSTDTAIYIEAGWKNCNTDVQSNQTHIVVNSTLYIDLSSTFQNVTPRVISSIRCVFHNEILWSSGYNPAGGIYTIIEKLEGDGTFIPEFQLFIGDQPIPQNFTLSATDDITVQIRIKTEESQYKVVISECWATPTENSNDLTSFPFIRDSCALLNTFTTIHTNGISNNATFQTKIFSFVDNPIVYLHCRLHVCKEEPLKTCKPTCNGFRLATTGENVFTGVTRMGPLRKSDQSDQDSPPSGTLGPGYIALIVIGVLLLVAMVVSILICWHERRSGNYNFKIKTQDVGYQVFSN